jgi:adenylyltransferase and sulfurtransferase
VTDYCVQIDNQNAMQLIGGYDLVLDCSDNPATRYLINDSCVLADKTLVSASALRWEGQLTVYNDRQGGPCYRCLYPTPPNPKFVTNCSDGGVLGVGKSIRFDPRVTPNIFFLLLFCFLVPGLMGTLQAMEAIKILLGLRPSYTQRLLIFDGESGLFRVVKLRSRQTNCAVCGDDRTITDLSSFDYTLFCGRGPTDKVTGAKTLTFMPSRYERQVLAN